jgi:hypothetical protein
MRLDNHSEELRPGRLFTHGRLSDPMTGGALYCRGFDGEWVHYEEIYHRADGSERIGAPWRLPIGDFIEGTFGGWYEGSSPPPAAPDGLGVSPCPSIPARSEVGQPTPEGSAARKKGRERTPGPVQGGWDHVVAFSSLPGSSPLRSAPSVGRMETIPPISSDSTGLGW